MNTVLFVNATIGFSENLYLVINPVISFHKNKSYRAFSLSFFLSEILATKH